MNNGKMINVITPLVSDALVKDLVSDWKLFQHINHLTLPFIYNWVACLSGQQGLGWDGLHAVEQDSEGTSCFSTPGTADTLLHIFQSFKRSRKSKFYWEISKWWDIYIKQNTSVGQICGLLVGNIPSIYT